MVGFGDRLKRALFADDDDTVITPEYVASGEDTVLALVDPSNPNNLDNILSDIFDEGANGEGNTEWDSSLGPKIDRVRNYLRLLGAELAPVVGKVKPELLEQLDDYVLARPNEIVMPLLRKEVGALLGEEKLKALRTTHLTDVYKHLGIPDESLALCEDRLEMLSIAFLCKYPDFLEAERPRPARKPEPVVIPPAPPRREAAPVTYPIPASPPAPPRQRATPPAPFREEEPEVVTPLFVLSDSQKNHPLAPQAEALLSRVKGVYELAMEFYDYRGNSSQTGWALPELAVRRRQADLAPAIAKMKAIDEQVKELLQDQPRNTVRHMAAIEANIMDAARRLDTLSKSTVISPITSPFDQRECRAMDEVAELLVNQDVLDRGLKRAAMSEQAAIYSYRILQTAVRDSQQGFVRQ